MKRVVGLNIRYKAERKQRQQAQITRIRADITIKERRQSNANMECGVSDWLTTLPKEWDMISTNSSFETPSKCFTSGTVNVYQPTVFVEKTSTLVTSFHERKVD